MGGRSEGKREEDFRVVGTTFTRGNAFPTKHETTRKGEGGGGGSERHTSGIVVRVEPGKGDSAGVVVRVHALPLIHDERALGEVVEGVLLLFLLLAFLLFSFIASGSLLLLGLLFLRLGLSLGLGLLLWLLFLFLLGGDSNLLGEGGGTLDGEVVGLVDNGDEPASGVHESGAEGGVKHLQRLLNSDRAAG